MPTPKTSPPLRQSRSPSKRRGSVGMASPMVWSDAAVPPPIPVDFMNSHRSSLASPMPLPIHISTPDTPQSSRLPSRVMYEVSSPRHRSSPKPAMMIPPTNPSSPIPKHHNHHPTLLLPAMPIAVDVGSTKEPKSPKKKKERLVIRNEDPPIPESPGLQARIIVENSDSSYYATPPRPARRRRDSAASGNFKLDYLSPQPPSDFSRSPSPQSISTIATAESSTPKINPRLLNDENVGPSSPKTVNTPNKRDSTQRRLSALRGLVPNLDFDQPWGSTKMGSSTGFTDFAKPIQASGSSGSLNNNGTGWACIPEREEILHSPSPARIINPQFYDHGWSTPRSTMSTKTTPTAPHSSKSTPRGKAKREITGVANSGYNASLLDSPANLPPPTPEATWRSQLPSEDIYQQILSIYGMDEIKRQEIIWEMCETEQSFLKSIRNVLRLFATPLKTPQGKWIDGIPLKVSDLFDALENLARVHGIIAAHQRDLRRKNSVIDLNTFIRGLKGWIPKLEVYEWYLLTFECVISLIEEHTKDEASVFGEFIRMQVKDEVLGSMTLGSMLLKPVQRLMKYPLFLKRLVDVTPRHPELLALVTSTESTILNLQASKAKEEDYNQLIQLETQISGLPPSFDLAKRGRKLLGCGQVLRINSLPMMTTPSRSSVASTSTGSSWDPSQSSASYRSSSFSTCSATSSAPSRSNSLKQPPSPSTPSSRRPSLYRSPSSASSVYDASVSRPTTPSKKGKNKDECTLFVFDDLVIVATYHKEGVIFKSRRDKGWKVSQGGIGKVLEVKDWSGFRGHTSLFSITIMSLEPINDAPIPITFCFTIPSTSTQSPKSPKFKLPSSLSSQTLSTFSQFMAVLSQTTAPISGSTASYYDDDAGFLLGGGGENSKDAGNSEGVEILSNDGLQDEVEHHLQSLKAFNFAQ